MIDRKTAVLIAMLGVSMLFAAVAASAATSFGDGGYTLELPGVGEFEFFVDANATDVVAIDAPAGFEVDDGADAVAWKAAEPASVPDIEIRPDGIEAGVTWVEGPVTLSLPDGSITISEPDDAGEFSVTATGELWAFGGGVEWYVADDENLRLARSFFKIEANSRGVKIKAVKAVEPAFLRNLDGEDDRKGQGKANGVEKSQGKSNGKGRGNG
jgi:hypothetical protein